jgi:hypothetical protein
VRITWKCASNQVIYLRLESLCGYWDGEPRCKKVSAPILVKCNHTQIINKITLLSDNWLRLMDSWYGLLVFIDVNYWRVIL